MNFRLTRLRTIYLIYVIFILVITFLPIDIILLYIFPDDSYYYFEIAKNAAVNGFISFDNINKTNGFHPLWFIMLIPIFILNLDKIIALRIILLFQGIIIGIAVYFIYKIIRIYFDEKSGLFGSLIFLFLPLSFLTYLDGCEASLNILLLAIVIYQLLINDFSNLDFKHTLFLGFSFSLSFLTRLDNIILITPILCWLLFTNIIQINKKNIKYIFTFFISFSILPGLYFLWAFLNFGHLMPISGVIWNNSTQYTIIYLCIIVITCFFLSILYRIIYTKLMKRKWERSTKNGKILIIILLLPIFHLLYYFTTRGRFMLWYLPIELIFIAIGGSLVFYKAFGNIKKGKIFSVDKEKFTIAITALSFIFSYGTIYFSVCAVVDIKVYHLSPRYYEATQWVNNHIPENATMASANAGFLGYFIDRTLIECWGLVNSYEFLETYNANVTKYIIEGDYDYYIDQIQYIPLSAIEMNSYGLVLNISFVDFDAPERTLQIWYKS
ncbi:MAG: glycosyltransferase family 39 protein [Candidatus Lokiarchaeota archaeon]|nr:glycosyltransferase family 39 protein [Candidatus Lokiarchaeota archaeon]